MNQPPMIAAPGDDQPPRDNRPPYYPAPPAESGSSRVLAALPHFGSLIGLGFIIVPIIVLFVASDEFVKANAREALNFHISVIIYGVLCFLLIFVFIGIPLLIALGIFAFICTIIATIKALEGQLYAYPLSIRMIK